MIDNFILVYFRTANYRYPKILDFCYRNTVSQIESFYPKAKIHVLTNADLPTRPNIKLHKVSNDLPLVGQLTKRGDPLPAKFMVFDLLDEPAMHLDLDLRMNNPFFASNLEVSNKINLYKINWNTNYQKVSSRPLSDEYASLPHYNTGVVWIEKPGKELAEEIIDIKRTYFDDPELFYLCDKDTKIKGPAWNSEEFPVSMYIKLNGLTMGLDDRVNKFRWEIEKSDICGYQTVHYHGWDEKPRLMRESRKCFI
jgi:hypothetical protein